MRDEGDRIPCPALFWRTPPKQEIQYRSRADTYQTVCFGNIHVFHASRATRSWITFAMARNASLTDVEQVIRLRASAQKPGRGELGDGSLHTP